MPYGVAKNAGGDNAQNTAFMERCVSALQKKGKDKVSAIKICKYRLQKMRSE